VTLTSGPRPGDLQNRRQPAPGSPGTSGPPPGARPGCTPGTVFNNSPIRDTPGLPGPPAPPGKSRKSGPQGGMLYPASNHSAGGRQNPLKQPSWPDRPGTGSRTPPGGIYAHSRAPRPGESGPQELPPGPPRAPLGPPGPPGSTGWPPASLRVDTPRPVNPPATYHGLRPPQHSNSYSIASDLSTTSMTMRQHRNSTTSLTMR
jgi:hypothetical protein